jgi:thioester reductase-like protein
MMLRNITIAKCMDRRNTPRIRKYFCLVKASEQKIAKGRLDTP